jgi:hypothetical protein
MRREAVIPGNDRDPPLQQVMALSGEHAVEALPKDGDYRVVRRVQSVAEDLPMQILLRSCR